MRRALPWVIGGLGALLLVVGVVVFAVADPSDVGWTAYAPLPSEFVFSDGAVLWTRQHTVGAGLAVVGLVVLAGLGGWFLGRGSASRPEIFGVSSPGVSDVGPAPDGGGH